MATWEEALAALKKFEHVALEEWEGKMVLEFSPGMRERDKSKNFIFMRTVPYFADVNRRFWRPTQEDMLKETWIIGSQCLF
jgi:hypothetical protein